MTFSLTSTLIPSFFTNTCEFVSAGLTCRCSVRPATNGRAHGFARPVLEGRARKKREDIGVSCQWESRKNRSGFRSNVSNSIVITTANSAPCSGVRPARPGKSKNTVNFPASLRAESGACIFAVTSVGTVTACRPKKMLRWRCGGRIPEIGLVLGESILPGGRFRRYPKRQFRLPVAAVCRATNVPAAPRAHGNVFFVTALITGAA